MAGPPSAWIDTIGIGLQGVCHCCALVHTRAQRVVVAARHRRTNAEWLSCLARMRSIVSHVNVCSGKPSSVEVPLAWQSLVPPRPLGTWRVIDASLAPLWPGSRKTTIPAMFAGRRPRTRRDRHRGSDEQAGGDRWAGTQDKRHVPR